MKHTRRRNSLTRDSIRESAFAFQKSRCILTAFELDLFTALGDASRTSLQVSHLLQTDSRATDRLMNALCALKLLVKKDGKFRNAGPSREFLVRGSPGYLAGLMHGVHLWDTWGSLTEAVRRGSSIRTRPIGRRGADWLTAFIAAMHDRGSHQAQAAVSQINLQGVKRILDVGGGSGAYAMAFVRGHPGLRATVFDLPAVIPLTRRYIRAESLSGKVATRAGDYMRDELGRGYDLVFLSAIIHSNSPRDNRILLRKCARALAANGRVIVQDFIMEEDRTRPQGGALFALNMLVGTQSGDTYTFSEVRSWMEEAGLLRIERLETPFGTTQITGQASTTGA